MGLSFVASVCVTVGPTAIAADATRVSSGARSSRAVALTFDDGYDRAACGRIARTLRAHGARGTFFINGVNLRSSPGAWRRILRGQAVGNHTWSHADLTHQADAAVRAQILRNEAVHERILGRPMAKWLRPPYGAEDPRVRRIAGALGYRRTVLWSVDTGDWRSSATVRSIVDRATGAPAGSIILMHCGPEETPLALPAIIRHYQARGLELSGLASLLSK
jgi:peptidoglycan/xylan/chitin deacetylase (PgdA/CDA1 family)